MLVSRPTLIAIRALAGHIQKTCARTWLLSSAMMPVRKSRRNEPSCTPASRSSIVTSFLAGLSPSRTCGGVMDTHLTLWPSNLHSPPWTKSKMRALAMADAAVTSTAAP